MFRTILKAKIHGARVTQSNVNYEGLMEAISYIDQNPPTKKYSSYPEMKIPFPIDWPHLKG